MILAQKETHRSMEQYGEPRTCGQLIYNKGGKKKEYRINPRTCGQLIYNKGGKNTNIIREPELQIKKTGSSINITGETGQLMQKNQTGLLSHTTHKNKLKTD